jgi:hypothetical protein
MVIFNSYVKLPEGKFSADRTLNLQMCQFLVEGLLAQVASVRLGGFGKTWRRR